MMMPHTSVWPRLKPSLCILAATAFLQACGANYYAVNWDYSVQGNDSNHPKSIVIDAKQRAILAIKGGPTNSQHVVVCAEPSPDALSAIASTFSSNLTQANGQSSKDLAVAFAQQEKASSIGIRDATIQILRDGLYRQCEAYMNGVITSDQYEVIANRYVDGAVTLLAVEGLTSAAPAPGTVLSPSAGAVIATPKTLAPGSTIELPPKLTLIVPDNSTIEINGKDATLNGDGSIVFGKGVSATLTESATASIPKGTTVNLSDNADATFVTAAKYTLGGNQASAAKDSKLALKKGVSVKLTQALPIDGKTTVNAEAGNNAAGGTKQASNPSKPNVGVSPSVATAVTNVVRQFLQKSAFDEHARSCLTFLNQSLADIKSKQAALEKQQAIEKKQTQQKAPTQLETLETKQLSQLQAAKDTSITERHAALTDYITCLGEYPAALKISSQKPAAK